MLCIRGDAIETTLVGGLFLAFAQFFEYLYHYFRRVFFDLLNHIKVKRIVLCQNSDIKIQRTIQMLYQFRILLQHFLNLHLGLIDRGLGKDCVT